MQHASIQGATARSSHTHSPAKQPHTLTLPSLLPLHPPSPLTYPLQAFFNLKQSELTKREGILEERLEQLHRSEGKLREREESSERTNREVVTQETALRTQRLEADARSEELQQTARTHSSNTHHSLPPFTGEELQRRLEEVRGKEERLRREQYDLQVCMCLAERLLAALLAVWLPLALLPCSLLLLARSLTSSSVCGYCAAFD